MRSHTTGAITRNGWYLGMVAPISSILGLLKFYIAKMLWVSNNLSNNFNGGLARAFASLRAVLCVNNSLSGRVAALLLGLATHYRES